MCFWNFCRGGVPLTAAGSPRRLRDDFGMIFDGFRSPFGEPRGSLWGSFGRQSLQPGAFMSIFRCFFWCLKKRVEKGTESSLKRSLFGGGRHGSSVVNSSKNLVFHVFKQTPFFFTFGSIFCSILESFWEPSSSLYSFWSPGWPKQAHKTQAKKQRKKR